ncbi:reverse transcriptase domain-containing protein [Tanacetum coccineum]
MSTRTTSSNLYSPLRDPESLIRRRNLGELSSLFDFEEVISIPHNNQGTPPAGPPPPNNNGPPSVVRPNGPAPRLVEEVCQPSINGRGRPIAPIPIQATDFRLRYHMINNSVSYDGPTILPTPSPLPKEVERETEATKDKKKLSLPELTPTRMTLELADRSVAHPKGVAEDVFMKVGKFYFPADFVVVDYDVDPRVPLIIGRPFLRTARDLIDVHGEELTLRVNDEAITFKIGHTSRYSHYYYDEMVHHVNVIDVVCEEYAQEVLGFSDSSTSGNPTPSDPIIASSSPLFTPFEGGYFILEEIETFICTPEELSNLDDDYYDTEGDILYLEKLLNEDPSPNFPSMKNDDFK